MSWVVDNGSWHREPASVARLQPRYPNLRLVHLPRHVYWLNQIEIYFSLVQRKALRPNDFTSLTEVEHCLLAFQERYEQMARALEWHFARSDLAQVLARLADQRTIPVVA